MAAIAAIALAPAIAAADEPLNEEADGDLEMLAVERAQAATAPFEFHGYLRSGFGADEKGGRQDAFGLPGAGLRGSSPTKYRLGNETETYGEAILVDQWLEPSPATGATFKTEVLIAFVTSNLGNSDATNTFLLRESFAEAGGVVRAAKEIKFWAGQRFYQRQSIHVNDIHFLDMSGYGGGVTDVPVGAARLSAAYLGGSTDAAFATTRAPAFVSQTPAKHTLDVRLGDVPFLSGRIMLWLAGSHVSAANGAPPQPTAGAAGANGARLPEVDGYGAGVFHQIEDAAGNFQRFTVQLGAGPMLDFNAVYKPTASHLAAARDAGAFLVQHARRLRLTETVLFQPSLSFSIMAAAIYQHTDFGALAGNAKETWYSAGLRPTWHAGRYFGVTGDAGIDYIDSGFAPSGYLVKAAIAPQVTAGHLFSSRPSIRAYVSGATWDSALKGSIGGPAHASDRFGLGVGAQMESWW